MSLIHEQIIKIMSDIPAIEKNRKNAQQGYNFRGIDDMYNALHPLLAKHQVFATSDVIRREREERQTKSGGVLIYTIMDVQFTFFASDGTSVQSTMTGEAMDSGDKSANKAMSSAYKYALMQLFAIPTEEPKDTEEETHEVAPRASVNIGKITKDQYDTIISIAEGLDQDKQDKVAEWLKGDIKYTAAQKFINDHLKEKENNV